MKKDDAMTKDLADRMRSAIEGLHALRPAGRVIAATGGVLTIGGLGAARLGDRTRTGAIVAEVIRVGRDGLTAIPDGGCDGVATGDAATLMPRRGFAPDESWIGRVVDPEGRPLDGRPLLPGPRARPVRAAPPPPHDRRPMGARMGTGLAVFDTLLPLARGQRMGLFAGSGVGKSTLLGQLARGVDADVIVVGLVGERGRELRHFVENVLGPEGMTRCVVVAATSDAAPQARRRCAWSATAVAEHFRDEGRQVLLLIDSVTRFAESLREIAAAAGEPTTLRGFPATTGAEIAALCERAGPGAGDAGDITAIYSVLVAGGDMDEPVADMLRGVLDGHVVLDREIAERGRFPAIDVPRSVSRSLPDIATTQENALIADARRLMSDYDRAAMMIRAGLYVAGADVATDAAIAGHPALETFVAAGSPSGGVASFGLLRRAVDSARGAGR